MSNFPGRGVTNTCAGGNIGKVNLVHFGGVVPTAKLRGNSWKILCKKRRWMHQPGACGLAAAMEGSLYLFSGGGLEL